MLHHLGAVLLLMWTVACTPVPLDWSSLKQTIRGQFPSVTHITTTDFKENYLGQSLVIDVRDQAEFAVSHIAGAVHFQEVSKLATWLRQQPAQPIVVYCSVGYRSAKIAQALQQEGFGQVVNLEGSIFEWANRGEAVVTASGPVQKVHPFNKKWGQLLEPKFHP